jgi:hypothetical protein
VRSGADVDLLRLAQMERTYGAFKRAPIADGSPAVGNRRRCLAWRAGRGLLPVGLLFFELLYAPLELANTIF